MLIFTYVPLLWEDVLFFSLSILPFPNTHLFIFIWLHCIMVSNTLVQKYNFTQSFLFLNVAAPFKHLACLYQNPPPFELLSLNVYNTYKCLLCINTFWIYFIVRNIFYEIAFWSVIVQCFDAFRFEYNIFLI